MPDKISQAQWKAFVLAETKNVQPKVELDDKNLLKALAELDRTDERKPEARLAALEDLAREIPRQVTALAKLKKPLGDKPFGKLKDKLYEILEDAQALQKKTQAALDAHDDEDEESAPAALVDPKLLLRQLAMCRKAPDLRMKFAFVDGHDKQPATLALHPRSSARALFARLQAASGAKTGAYGTAWVDGTTLMLQLDKPLSGLVKKVRAPVKACGFNIARAVIWNEDGSVFEQDDSAEDAVGAASDGPSATASTTPTTPTTPATPGATPPSEGAPTAPPPPSATYAAKLADLAPRVKKAADEGHAEAAKHQAVLAFAQNKAAADDFLGAMAALRQLEKLLDAPTPAAATASPSTDTPAPASTSADDAAAFKARMLDLVAALKDAQATNLAGAQDARLKASEAGVFAGKRDFAQANALLDEAQDLLAAAQDERTRLRLRERVLVADAQRGYADYLAIRDTSGDVEALVDALGAAETLWQAWEDDYGEAGADDPREEMRLLEQKLVIERESLQDLLDRLVALEALMAQRDAEADPDRRIALQAEMHVSLEDLAA